MKIRLPNLESYLRLRFGEDVKIEKATYLGSGFHGSAYRIEVRFPSGREDVMVLKTLSGKGFGHDYPADRAQVIILAHDAFNKLPKHVKSFDAIGIKDTGRIVSLSGSKEFAILMDEVKGTCHMDNFERIRKSRKLRRGDMEPEVKLAKYIADIHLVKHNNPSIYRRKLRDTIGHGECLMGVIDTYPRNPGFTTHEELGKIVQMTIPWWSRLKFKSNRLCQVHGDFYPGNIYFNGGDFTVLDRGRGLWGEAADDITAYTINYISHALWSEKNWKGPFKKMFSEFFKVYLKKTGDHDIFKFLAPFFAFRGVVVTHPIFYPNLPAGARIKILNFVRNILQEDEFQLKDVKRYLEGSGD